MSILAITTPIYTLIATGFIALKTGYLMRDVPKALGSFVIRICMPVMIIGAVNRQGGAALNWHFMMVYGGASLVLLLGGMWVMRYFRKNSITESALYGLGMSNSNSGFLGYPIAALVVGEVAFDILAWALIVENMLMIPLAIALADAGAYPDERFTSAFGKALKGLYKNPIFVGLIIGLAIRITGLPIPEVLWTVIKYFTATAPVVALFVVGATVASFPVKAISVETAMIATGKLVVHPVLVTAGMLAFPMADPSYMLGAALFAAVPMLSIFPIFGQRYGVESITATTLVFTTTLSFFTVSGLIYLMG
ncbi:AEC family transporter [Donghicola sp. XS_ASV15]|uniref:AEC family transporter n=1 Tax=Donghicola sp. XS_ASV15 TaxID=3241295 RepID=UPI003514925A